MSTALEVLYHPHENLRVQAKEVNEITPALTQFIDSMLHTMYTENGIGLAATQVNSQDRIFVMDISGQDPYVFINPKIKKTQGQSVAQEGCLSFPGVWVDVPREEFVTVEAIDKAGKAFALDVGGLMARCILHEFDHLNGVVLIDRISRLKRERALKKYFQDIKDKAKGK